jgi:hypothetical protein
VPEDKPVGRLDVAAAAILVKVYVRTAHAAVFQLDDRFPGLRMGPQRFVSNFHVHRAHQVCRFHVFLLLCHNASQLGQFANIGKLIL